MIGKGKHSTRQANLHRGLDKLTERLMEQLPPTPSGEEARTAVKYLREAAAACREDRRGFRGSNVPRDYAPSDSMLDSVADLIERFSIQSETEARQNIPEGRGSLPAGALESGSPLDAARGVNPGGAAPGGVGERSDDKLHADTPRTNAHLSHLNLPDGRKVGIPDQTVALLRELERRSTRAVTKEMVDRFLSWRLPKDFSPDNGISFKPIDHPHGLTHLWPTGTNLLNADQAKAMLEHVLAVVQSAVAPLTDETIIAAFSAGGGDDAMPTRQPHAPLLTNTQIVWVVRRFLAGSAPQSAIGEREIRERVLAEAINAVLSLTDHKVSIYGWQRAVTEAIRALYQRATDSRTPVK